MAWLRHPGIASVFSLSEGMAHEGNTSSDEINIWIGNSIARTTRLSTSSSHKSPGFKLDVGIIYESKFRSS